MCLQTHERLNKIIYTYTGQAHKIEFLLQSSAELIELVRVSCIPFSLTHHQLNTQLSSDPKGYYW